MSHAVRFCDLTGEHAEWSVVIDLTVPDSSDDDGDYVSGDTEVDYDDAESDLFGDLDRLMNLCVCIGAVDGAPAAFIRAGECHALAGRMIGGPGGTTRVGF